MCEEKKTDGIQCSLCGKTFDTLYNVEEESTVIVQVCEDCYFEIEGEPPHDMVRFRKKRNLQPGKELGIPSVPVTIIIDRKMMSHLEAQSEMGGFLNVEGYIHSILFREAVCGYLENAEDQIRLGEKVSLDSVFKEFGRWLTNGQR